MLLIWNGRGLLALGAIGPIFMSCGLLEVEPRWLFGAAVAFSFYLAGIVCVYFGNIWNKDRREHHMYFIPLEIWGWFYFSLPVLVAILLIVSAVTVSKWSESERVILAVAGVSSLILNILTCIVVVRLARAKYSTSIDSSDYLDVDSQWQSDLQTPPSTRDNTS